LGIAAEEDDDGQAVKGENTAQNQNRSSQERQRRPQGQPQQPAANPQNQQQTPATPQGEQAQQTQQTSGTQANGSHPVDLEWKKARRLLAALLGEGYLGFTKAKAEEFLKAHGEGKASTSEMTIDQLNACIAAAQQVLTKMRDEAASKATEQAAGQANQEIKDLDDSKPEGE
jgi:hypothetical protein